MSDFKLARLCRILSINRADNGPGPQSLLDAVFQPYEYETYKDPAGNPLAVVIMVGESRTLFSCHLDTCEKWDPLKPTRKIKIDKGLIAHSDGAHVLGADCGAGIAILLHMIDHNVPGAYIFHFGEEVGGFGSTGMVRHHSNFLIQFDRAIAFDRKATHSVITHMWNGRTCSDEFADDLSLKLTGDEYFYSPDDTGSFTDTTNYTDLIGECTNVSVGYANEHTTKETLDLNYLGYLADQVLLVDWENLPMYRQPGEADPDAYSQWKANPGYTTRNSFLDTPYVWEDLLEMDYAGIKAWIRRADPAEVADIICDMVDELSWKAPVDAPKPKTKQEMLTEMFAKYSNYEVK